MGDVVDITLATKFTSQTISWYPILCCRTRKLGEFKKKHHTTRDFRPNHNSGHKSGDVPVNALLQLPHRAT